MHRRGKNQRFELFEGKECARIVIDEILFLKRDLSLLQILLSLLQ